MPRSPDPNGFPVISFWDIRDLDNAKHTGCYKSPVGSIDHSHYVRDGLICQPHNTARGAARADCHDTSGGHHSYASECP